jgi:NitT/TauT family transport system permease protein
MTAPAAPAPDVVAPEDAAIAVVATLGGTPPRRGAVARRVLRKTVILAVAVTLLGLAWTGYKAMGQATDDTWPGTSIELPVKTDDTTLPAFTDILTRPFEAQRAGDDTLLWRTIWDAAAFTFVEAVAGFAVGIAVGLVLALVMLRARFLERGLLPWIVVSQTVPLIALAPVIVAWGHELTLPGITWEPWMSVSIIATYLTFFPVAVSGLRGLQSPAPHAVELMASFAATWRQELVRLRFPAALPYLIPALKVAATASVVGAIVGEISAGVAGGLGRLILSYSQQYLSDPARLYCAVVGAGLLGVAFVGLIGVAERVLLRNRLREAR